MMAYMKSYLTLASMVMAFVSSSFAYNKVGCYEGGILDGTPKSSSKMTIQMCVEMCSHKGDNFAGLMDGNECYCGRQLKEYQKLRNSECSTQCSGSKRQKCGGPGKILVYKTNVEYLGCVEDVGPRVVDGDVLQGNVTTGICINLCRMLNREFALTEYSRECFCGKLKDGVTLDTLPSVPESDCDMTCAGDDTEICGASRRGSLYKLRYCDKCGPSDNTGKCWLCHSRTDCPENAICSVL